MKTTTPETETTTVQQYLLPEYGVVVEAASVEEAVAKVKQSQETGDGK